METASPSQTTRQALLAAFGVQREPASAPTEILVATPPPAAIAGVRLLRRLGRGGNAEVYLGHHEALDVEVAVKLLHDPACSTLIDEARAVARIQHPHVVRVLNAGWDGERAFLVMEYVPGGDLGCVLRGERCLPWQRALDLVAQAADGLAAAHAAGFVHSDVKPTNLLLDADGRVKLADLGLARPLRHQPGPLVSGTPAYMAPEQRAGGSLMPASDIFGLGATLCVLLTGVPPGPEGELPPLPGDVPAPVREALTRMLARDPRDRPIDGAAAGAVIRAAMAASQPQPPATGAQAAPTQPGERPPRRRRGAGGAIAGALLATAAITALLLGGHRAEEWRTPPRAVFIDGVGLGVRLADDIERRVRAGGLPMIERGRVESLVREQDLARDGRVDPDTAMRFGRLVGGHLAVLIEVGDGEVRAAVVAIESGERLGTTVVRADAAAEAIAGLLADAARRLPARGSIDRRDDGWRLDLGGRNGVAVGDRFRVLDGSGLARAVATVTACDADGSTVTVAGSEPKSPARVERVAR